MKMLFSAPDCRQVAQIRKQLFEAGIQCEIRQNAVAQGVLGLQAIPELWVRHDGDILKALQLLGPRRQSQMTVLFSAS